MDITGTLMAAVGAALLVGMRFATPKLHFVVRRLSAGAFAGAGVMGVDGWLGRWIEQAVDWGVGFVNSVGNEALGAGTALVIALGLGCAWVGALLPNKLFSFQFPDWLVIAGLVLPGLLASVPGKLGDGLRVVVERAGEFTTGLVSGLLS